MCLFSPVVILKVLFLMSHINIFLFRSHSTAGRLHDAVAVTVCRKRLCKAHFLSVIKWINEENSKSC